MNKISVKAVNDTKKARKPIYYYSMRKRTVSGKSSFSWEADHKPAIIFPCDKKMAVPVFICEDK
jgi:hypothetical protein